MNAGESVGLLGIALAIGFFMGRRDEEDIISTPYLPPTKPTPPLAPERPPLPDFGGGAMTPFPRYNQNKVVVVDDGQTAEEELIIIEEQPIEEGVNHDAIPEEPITVEDPSFSFDGMYGGGLAGM